MHIHLTYHILIHMLIHISYISFTHAYTYLILTYHIMFHFLSSFIYILCHFTLCFLFWSLCTCHHITLICFSYHFISCHLSYSHHLHILVICFLCFMSAYTLKVDTGNYKYPNVLLLLYKTMNYKGPNVRPEKIHLSQKG